MPRIKRIIMVMEPTRGPHGIRVTRCRDGLTIEAQTQGGLSNIKAGLLHDGQDFRRDYYYYTRKTPQREIATLPVICAHPVAIRAWEKRAFRTTVRAFRSAARAARATLAALPT